MSENNTITPLSEKAIMVLDKIEKKYKLEESDDEVTTIIEKNGLFKGDIIANLAQDLVLEKVSNNQFLDHLHKELKLSKEEVKNLAIDIVHELVPLLKPFSQEEIKNYRSEKEPIIEEAPIKEYAKSNTQEAILTKINKSAPQKKSVDDAQEKKSPLPYDKKVETKNVEENAKNMERNLTDDKEKIVSTPPQEDLTKVKTVLPQETSKGPDSYRESIE